MKNLLFGFSALVVAFCLYTAIHYNRLVHRAESVNRAEANLETVYQKRADLIEKLVITVKGQSDFEQETLIATTLARARATQHTISPTEMSSKQLQEIATAQQQLSGSLERLLMRIEAYPDLQAIEGFGSLQEQLERIENTIAYYRKKYNEQVRKHNTRVMSFPTTMLADLLDFNPQPYFEAPPGSEVTPETNFE